MQKWETQIIDNNIDVSFNQCDQFTQCNCSDTDPFLVNFLLTVLPFIFPYLF